jgi:TIR domain
MPIFISYSHQDSDFALNLAMQLVTHKAKVWIDKWELNVGDSIIDRIQNAVEGATALLVILSKASVASEWVKKELNSGLIRELDEKRVIVLPILIEDCKIPMFLRDKKYADFTKDYDEGIQEVLKAIASISSQTLGRHEEVDRHLDWSIDYKIFEDIFTIDITIVEQAKDQPYTILTVIKIIADKVTTKRYKMFIEAGLDWFELSVIVCELARGASTKDIRLLLRDEHVQTTKIYMHDPKIKATSIADVTSRRLGNDTGRDILIDISGQLKGICEDQLKTLRELTPEESKKMKQIQAVFDKS